MDLVLLVCLASAPETCREERILVGLAPSDPRQCMMSAVPALAEWAGEHPDWQISRWTCGGRGTSQITRNFE